MGGNRGFWKAIEAVRERYPPNSDISVTEWTSQRFNLENTIFIVDTSVIMRQVLASNHHLAYQLFTSIGDAFEKVVEQLALSIKARIDTLIKYKNICYVLENGTGCSKISALSRRKHRSRRLNLAIRKLYGGSGNYLEKF
jgi:hypothetical protein